MTLSAVQSELFRPWLLVIAQRPLRYPHSVWTLSMAFNELLPVESLVRPQKPLRCTCCTKLSPRERYAFLFGEWLKRAQTSERCCRSTARLSMAMHGFLSRESLVLAETVFIRHEVSRKAPPCEEIGNTDAGCNEQLNPDPLQLHEQAFGAFKILHFMYRYLEAGSCLTRSVSEMTMRRRTLRMIELTLRPDSTPMSNQDYCPGWLETQSPLCSTVTARPRNLHPSISDHFELSTLRK